LPNHDPPAPVPWWPVNVVMMMGIVLMGVVVVVVDAIVAAVMEIVRRFTRSYRHTTGKTWEHAGVVRRNV
jgi:hypothetical protein